eukprot:CAMPEP_0179192082 /NCGR_PEP_ID=MMETSP0796-20121207/95418_1 /TAXON_ID=73915 /ORGANISM="Pyrodinium bahamense, Strain pbaha01" /LENGTH=45 /DNA_ID= /DNA_START= /DNA_END= /DNA_ORIENTATION=
MRQCADVQARSLSGGRRAELMHWMRNGGSGRAGATEGAAWGKGRE